MNDQTESTEDAESLEDSRTNAHEGGRSHQPASPVAASPRTGEGHSKKNRAKKSGGEAASSDPGSDGMVKAKKDKDGRRSGQKKKKSAERKEAKQDERETGTAATVPSSGDAPPDACASMEDGVKHDTPNPESAPHPPTPWPGRLHGQNGGGAGKGLPTNNAGATSKRNSSCSDAEQQQKNEKRQEKETSPEGVRPHGSPTSSDERALDKRRREERRERREQVKAETHVVADQQRRASSELLRGHKERGRAFWNKERTPRRGILTRSLSVENFSSHQSAEGQRDDAAVYKRKKSKKHKRKALQEEGVKFDKVMVRHYPREVGIGGCMLDPDQGPFLGIGWDWKQEEVHNLYSFERLREADRKHVAHAIPSMARHALLLQYGLGEDEIREMTLEMRRKDKLLRGGSSSILPSFWPWKKAG